MIITATAPVRWIAGLLRAEGATRSSVRNDPEFTRVENITAHDDHDHDSNEVT